MSDPKGAVPSREHINAKYHKDYRKIILRYGIIECTTLQHAKGLLRALQFHHLKDLEPIPLSLKENIITSLAALK